MSKTFNLHNGIEMPAIGFGTYKLQEGEECYNAVKFALDCGYRHIDTAAIYENEVSVGKAIKDSTIPREKIFVTTKVWNTERSYAKTMKAFEASLERLQMEYVDLYLVHWPANSQQFSNAKELNAETWRAMEEIYTSGKAKAIGVSNFLVHHLKDLMETAAILPMVNQIEYHPGYLQQDTVDFCQDNNIVVEAWSPLGRGRVLYDTTLLEIAYKHNTTTSDVCLQFALQQGICVLPKSATTSRIMANFQSKIELKEDQIQAIKHMPEIGFSGLHPDFVTF